MKRKLKLDGVLFKVSAIFIGACLVLVASVLVAQRSALHSFFKDIVEDKITNAGSHVVLSLQKQLHTAGSMAAAMANLAETLPNDESLYRYTIPNMLDYEVTKDLIAGGGIWPEPYTFDSSKERRSFFWGRDESQKFEYFNDYNDPKGNGYHNEEWYVPAKYTDNDGCYWSKSYVDPYSFEPMVTCTVAMKRNNLFVGASTVDIRLEGIRTFLENHMKAFNGYAFVLDRNNKFISYPQPGAAKGSSDGTTGEHEYITANQFTQRHREFKDINIILDEINERIKSVAEQSSKYNRRDVRKLSEESYQISNDDAPLILSSMVSDISDVFTMDDNLHEAVLVRNFTRQSDLIIDEPVQISVFVMPETFWKVVLVVPENLVSGPANEISIMVSTVVLAVTLLILIFIFFMMQKTLVNPIGVIIRHLTGNVELKEDIKPLELSGAFEFQEIAKRYNERTQQFVNAKNEAEHANKLKSEFLATMSHEIRTPLNGVIGLSSLLESTELDDGQKGYVKDIHYSADLLLAIINDILDISKLESGKVELEEKAFNIHATFTNVLEGFRTSAKQKGLNFKVSIDPDVPVNVVGDSGRISQILINLVGNSIKFTDTGGVYVWVKNEVVNNDEVLLHVSVQDTGIGIDEDSRASLFDKFTQADASITRQYGGTGLGLAICRSLLDLMRGEIVVESVVSKGSTFTFKIPLKEASISTIEAASSSASFDTVDEMVLHGKKALVAEDNLINQKLLVTLLKKWGMDVSIASDGVEAVNHCTEQEFDIIVMDVNMPHKSGLEATQEIRENIDMATYVPIIAVTAKAMKGDKEKCLAAGMNDYVSKPIDSHTLRSKMIYWIQKVH